MSKIISSKSYLLNSAMGDVKVQVDLVEEFDIEDICRTRALSQARLVQFVNIGSEINRNAVLPTDAISSVFLPTGGSTR